MRAFAEAVAALAASDPRRPARVGTVQMLFSDPTIEPLEALDRKGAVGASDRQVRSGPGDGASERRRP